jgi:hypothetical protein
MSAGAVSNLPPEAPVEAKTAITSDFTPQNEIQALIRQKALENEINPDVFVAIAKAESGLRADAYNPESHRSCNGSYSLFQVACLHYEQRGIYGEERFNPEVNIGIAVELYEKHGTQPWTVCKKLVDCSSI